MINYKLINVVGAVGAALVGYRIYNGTVLRFVSDLTSNDSPIVLITGSILILVGFTFYADLAARPIYLALFQILREKRAERLRVDTEKKE